MTAADDHLLFGMIALRNGLIDQHRLVAAFRAWTRDKARPLADHLAEHGGLDAEGRAAVEAIVALLLRAHDGDPARGLASIPAGRSTREGLSTLGDPELDASLARLDQAETRHDPYETRHDPEPDGRAGSYTVGASSADGLRYRVLRPHARGGLGAVFVALDGELHREVALKQIREDHADDPVSRQRFLIEAEITGGLEHPGIVPVYGLGTYGDGRPYYAMRFIRGDSLKEAIERFHADEATRRDPGRRSLELRKLLGRFLDVCDAIDYAHSRGVLHRDIKPGNIIVGKHGETLIVDWGLAKARGSDRVPNADADEQALTPASASGSIETLPGSAMGTPAFMSPEQASGDLDRLGPPSDVYSLGATLYCLLTGRRPFVGDDVLAVLDRVRRGDLPPPRQLDRSIPPALEAICLKEMALDPARRYGTPRALADDLERWLADEPVSAWREPPRLRLRRWTRRHRLWVAGSAAALVVAGICLSAATLLLSAKNRELEAANARERRARQDAEEGFRQARQAVDTYYTRVSEQTLLREGQFQPLRKTLLESALDYYRDFLRRGGGDPEIRRELADAAWRVATITDEIGSSAEARAFASQARDLFAELVRAEPDDLDLLHKLTGVTNNLATIEAGMGRTEEARANFLRTLELRERLVERDPDYPRQQLAYIYDNVGTVHLELGRPEEGLSYIREGLAIMEALLAEAPEDVEYRRGIGYFFNNLANAHQALGEPGRAVEYHARAVEVRRGLVEAVPENRAFREYLGKSHLRLGEQQAVVSGDSTDADDSLEEARRIFDQLTEEVPANTEYQIQLAAACQAIADRLNGRGRWDEALERTRQGLDATAIVLASNPEKAVLGRYQGLLLLRQGTALEGLGRPAEAIRAFDEAIERLQWQQMLAPEASSDGRSLGDALDEAHVGAATSRCALGLHDEAIALLTRRKQARPRDPGGLFAVARGLAACAGVVAASSAEADPDAKPFADAAMLALSEAIAVGWTDRDRIAGDPAFSTLRGRDDFRAFVDEPGPPTVPPAR